MDATGPTEIVLGVTGSIAAYKAAELTRLFIREGWTVHVVMTRAATEFVAPLTFQTLSRNPVATDPFAPPAEWKPAHVSLADRADALVIAPATANIIAKLALGLADDLLSSTALACPAPLVIAPAMNDIMFDHPATQANLRTLEERGARIVAPGRGDLACGREGRGRMAEPAEIVAILAALLDE
ncbi:MAG: flavoprotein [Kiritimatiellia bacterium]|jgi:phosphopantothenoylcysteine decarboxylase/phosphopantothenate--cysteine ligase